MGDLSIKCLFRVNGIECHNGRLYDSVTGYAMGLEGISIDCPACEGKSEIPTALGRELLAFLAKFGQTK